ncbi:MAG: TolC family outer membrane protein [Telluria sp.]|nr:TolC family outer membrane protein [Telluria sp.]
MHRAAGAVCAFLLMLAAPAGATTLLQAWQAAQQHDPEFAAARAAFEAGNTRREQASALWRPSLVLSAGAGRMSGDTSMSGAQFSAPGFGQSSGVRFDTSIGSGRMQRYTLAVKQPLLDRARLAQSRQLSLGADVAEAQWQDARQALMLRVSERYFEALVAAETLRLLLLQQGAVDRALAEARDRFKLGDVAVTDTYEAQARADTLTAQVLAADADLQLRQAAFSDLTGSAPQELAHPRAGPAIARTLAPLARWLLDTAANNPMLAIQQKNQAVAREEAARHAALGAPSLDLVAELGRDRQDGGGDFGSASNTASKRMIGVQLTVPLYTGGYRSAKRQEALHLVDQARAEGDRLRQQIALQTRAAWLGLTAGASRVAALEQAARSSRARLDATRLGHEVGDRTTLDLLNAENDATGAELALLQARSALALDRLRLSALAGTLDESTLRSVSEM